MYGLYIGNPPPYPANGFGCYCYAPVEAVVEDVGYDEVADPADDPSVPAAELVLAYPGI
jgi:hypothetical protein